MGNKNKNIFWYGFFANIKIVFGKFLILLSFFIGLFSLALENVFGIIIGILFLLGGIYLWAVGSSSRFDYKRKSGYIVHQGDRY